MFELYEGDAFDLLARTPTGAARLAIVDPPYGTTELEWDREHPPLHLLLLELRRVVRPDGVIVAFATHPFALHLLEVVRGTGLRYYELIWAKRAPTDPYNARWRPLRAHENIYVCYTTRHYHYAPQRTYGHRAYRMTRRSPNGQHYREGRVHVAENDGSRLPTSVIEAGFESGEPRIHPTQKPLALMRWLIRTYSKPEELVIDPFAGSGSSGVAALLGGRHWAGAERNPEYAQKARAWLEAVRAQPALFEEVAE